MKAIKTPYAPFRLSISGVHDLGRFVGEDAGPPISHMVSLLDPATPDPAQYGDLAAAWHRRIHLYDIIEPAANKELPTKEDVATIVEMADEIHADDGAEHVLVHCWLGMSRSFATAAIILGRHKPEAAEDIVLELAEHRNPCWPNSLILRIADDMLGTGGGFLRGAEQVYEKMAAQHPQFIGNLKSAGRGAELPAGY